MLRNVVSHIEFYEHCSSNTIERIVFVTAVLRAWDTFYLINWEYR